MRLSLKTLKTKALLVFPQGTRGRGLDEVNSGVGFLCKKAKLGVVAARVYGTDKVFPKGAKFLRRGRIRVVFARVDTITSDDTYQDISSKVMETIKNLK